MAYATKNYQTDGGNTWVVGGKMIFEEGATVEGLNGGGGSSYTLPTTSADTLGGVKVGSGLSINGGVLSADGVPTASADTLGAVKVGSGLTITDGVLSADGITPAANQAALEATELADVVTAFNALLSKLKTAGLMAADA